MNGEELSLFRVLKTLRRRDGRKIQQIQDAHGNTYNRPTDITETFVAHLLQKYGPINPDTQSMTTLQNFIPPVCPTRYADFLERPTTTEEILIVLRAGVRNKASGI
jgi:hypothetical protein